MTSKEIILRAEIDRLEAEVLWLQTQFTELKEELGDIKKSMLQKKHN